MTHLQNQVDIVAVLEIVVQLKDMKYLFIAVGNIRRTLFHPRLLIRVKNPHAEQ